MLNNKQKGGEVVLIRKGKIATALKAYAALTTSASKGAVRQLD